jgi:hypothetical protein
MDYIVNKSFEVNTELIGKGRGQIESLSIPSFTRLTPARKPDGYKSSQSSSVRFLIKEIQNAENALK